MNEYFQEARKELEPKKPSVLQTILGVINLALLVSVLTFGIDARLTAYIRSAVGMKATKENPFILGTLRDRVVVKKLNSERKTPGGIVIAETERTQIVFGEVFSVGRGNLTSQGVYVPLEVKSGDQILFHVGSSNEIVVEGEIFHILKESDILAVLSQNAKVAAE